ncbi:MAG: ribosomal protein S18-alanine N-acetyltransferase [Thermodesulfobacteriota bacterium]
MNPGDQPLPARDWATIEPMTAADLDQVMAIEQVSFRRPWTREGFLVELKRRPARCLVARQGRNVCGYLVFWLIPPEIHVLNLAVRPDLRRRKIGRLLMEYMLEYGRDTGAGEVFLEVRTSNLAAQELYRSLGFSLSGRRRDYYAEDHEDALIMAFSLDAPQKTFDGRAS